MRSLGRILKRILVFLIFLLICLLVFNLLNRKNTLVLIPFSRDGMDADILTSIAYDYGYDMIVIDPSDDTDDFINTVINDSKGVIFSGGIDFDPDLYGGSSYDLVEDYNSERDRADLELLDVAMAHNKPILGICRGMQLINIYHGGSLYEDIESQANSNISHRAKDKGFIRHSISIDEESRLFDKLSQGPIQEVNSLHHEGIRELGHGLSVRATSPDGIIEMIENETYPAYLLGIQWHPEYGYYEGDRLSKLIFDDFFKALSR